MGVKWKRGARVWKGSTGLKKNATRRLKAVKSRQQMVSRPFLYSSDKTPFPKAGLSLVFPMQKPKKERKNPISSMKSI